MGNYLIEVSEDPKFRHKIAKGIVEERDFVLGNKGTYYADPIAGKVYFIANGESPDRTPWSSDIDERIVESQRLIPDSLCFSSDIDWDDESCQIQEYEQMLADYIAANGSPPVCRSQIIAWARQTDWVSAIEDMEADAYQDAIDLVQSSILDCIEL
jgi:hypothetical protein